MESREPDEKTPAYLGDRLYTLKTNRLKRATRKELLAKIQKALGGDLDVHQMIEVSTIVGTDAIC